LDRGNHVAVVHADAVGSVHMISKVVLLVNHEYRPGINLLDILTER